MKIIASLLFVLLLSLNFCSQAQVILSYGNNKVSKEEFLKAFLKNNLDKHPSAQAYRDYLELYIRFKLKVKAAYDMKMDTLPNQKAELHDFRGQVEETYLNDEASFQSLLQEAFTRSQKDIHLAHIFISMDSVGRTSPVNPATRDTTRAWKLALKVHNDLEKGNDFGDLAYLYSSDASAKNNRGDIGYITLFTLPYALENLAYTTPVGKNSAIFRSNAGYHIFKNLGERKATGKVKAAQILLAFLPGSGDKEKAIVKQKADSIYNALLKGASFNQMVEQFSSDINAAARHGEIPEFGVGSFDSRFEEVVFALEKNGAFTKPIQTPVGYYIVKRLDQTPVNNDMQNDSAMSVLRQLVRNDFLRMEVSRKAMLQKIYKITGFKKTALPEKELLTFVENSMNANKDIHQPGISATSVLFSFPNQKVYVSDFIKYVKAGRDNNNARIASPALTQFEETRVREYYRNHLAEFNTDFAAQIKEFKEGNLLFEIMQRNIWDKASVDSSGLKLFFDKNKSRYWWEASADAIIFSSTDSSIAYELRSKLEKDIKNWRKSIAPYETKVQADSGRFELTQLPLKQQQTPAPGMLTAPLKIFGDNNTSFVHIIKLYPEKQPRNFEDAKGFVLNDYQSFLEDKWIGSLKKKYPVKVNEVVVKSLLK